jgi:flagellar motor protein MotB
MRGIYKAACAVCVLVVATGCASSKTKDRLNVALAELADQRQQNEQLTDQFQRTQADLDRATQQSVALEGRVASLSQQAAQDGMYKGQVVELQRQLADAQAKEAALRGELVAIAKRDAPKAIDPVGPSPQLEAFRADLQRKLSQYGVKDVDVEVRTTQSGERRVAIVLQNSFRPGNASLSYNAAAVKAVVGVGKLVAESYRGSRVTVEGHTDADPIRKSPWASNDALALARAEEVKKLLRQAGVPDTRISAVGLGSRHPVAKGTTDRAKAQNRRVEIYIYPASQ